MKPNGTLVLQARKHIKTDEEEQQLHPHRHLPRRGRHADNTILSTQLFDLELQKNHTASPRRDQDAAGS